MKKEITVLVPTYNRSKLLKRTLDSLSVQDPTIHINCVISDNCSTDDTKNLAGSFHQHSKNLKITYIRQDNQLSPLDNWKFLLSYMDTEYSKFLFDDDWLHEDALKIMFNDIEMLEADSLIYNTSIFILLRFAILWCTSFSRIRRYISSCSLWQCILC